LGKAIPQMKFTYDRRYDCLYALVLSDRGEHYGVELAPTIWVYRDIATNKPVGFYIEEYSRQFTPGKKIQIPDFSHVTLPDPATL